MSAGGVLPLPPQMPQFRQNAVRRLCAWCLHRSGWRIAGRFPNLPRALLIAAPHTSWWDGIWGLLFKIALGLDITFMGKRELFRGPLGLLLRRLGGIPVERSSTHGIVAQIVARFEANPRLWVGVAPEGTRKPVTIWRTGFWHIARAAAVPIVPIAFDYPSKTISIGAAFVPGDDLDTDLAALRTFYTPFRGKRSRMR